jgi:hypothetical protein
MLTAKVKFLGISTVIINGVRYIGHIVEQQERTIVVHFEQPVTIDGVQYDGFEWAHSRLYWLPTGLPRQIDHRFLLIDMQEVVESSHGSEQLWLQHKANKLYWLGMDKLLWRLVWISLFICILTWGLNIGYHIIRIKAGM